MDRKSRQRGLRVASAATCSCAARYQPIIDHLISDLQAANDQIAALKGRLARREPLLAQTPVAILTNGHVQKPFLSLTLREREVAQLFLQCANDKMVARRLGIAVQTVRNQIASIENKLGVNSREELILLLVSPRRNGFRRDGEHR